MYTITHFSPTGNGAHIARLLGEALATDNILAMEHTNLIELEATNHIIIIYAIHAFNAPKIVKGFVSQIPEGITKYVSLIGVGCNTTWINQAASKDLRTILEKKGVRVAADVVMAMPLTLVKSFPDELVYEQLDNAIKDIKSIADQIKGNIETDKTYPLNARLLQRVGKVEPFAARFFGLELHAKKSCTQCGLCVRECPTKNIRMKDNKKIKFGFKCMMCMRCMYNCPVNAITPRISKFVPIKNGYSIDKYVKKRG